MTEIYKDPLRSYGWLCGMRYALCSYARLNLDPSPKRFFQTVPGDNQREQACR